MHEHYKNAQKCFCLLTCFSIHKQSGDRIRVWFYVLALLFMLSYTHRNCFFVIILCSMLFKSLSFSFSASRRFMNSKPHSMLKMQLNCGIVGLPNVGKSTLFNALVGSEAAQAANFPFCTIGIHSSNHCQLAWP